jgi:hypothetical protein
MQNSANLSKIGIAKNPLKRKRQLELTSGLQIDIIRCWSSTEQVTAKKVEAYMHQHFARKRLQGEWFTQITPKEVEMAGYDLLECNSDGTDRRRIE